MNTKDIILRWLVIILAICFLAGISFTILGILEMIVLEKMYTFMFGVAMILYSYFIIELGEYLNKHLTTKAQREWVQNKDNMIKQINDIIKGDMKW